MATYNGAKYIREQLDSIVCQLQSDDELIVCDDISTDGTLDIIRSYADPRIRLFLNESHLGHVQNFNRAITLAAGRYIALCDQDDIWVESRLSRMCDLLKTLPRCSLVIGKFSLIDEFDRPVGEGVYLGGDPKSTFVLLLRIFLGKVKYYGCTFLFSSDLKDKILPIGPKIEAHDIWVAMNACVYGQIRHCQENTLLHRVHSANLTPVHRRRIIKVLKSRLIYLYWLVFVLIFR